VQPLHGQSSLAVLVRVLEQAVRDGIVDRNTARVTGWQHEFRRAQDELDDPRSLAHPDWSTLDSLAQAPVARSSDSYRGWGDVVIFVACTAARIREVPGCRVGDINTDTCTSTVSRVKYVAARVRDSATAKGAAGRNPRMRRQRALTDRAESRE
jgi:hypothetical protein